MQLGYSPRAPPGAGPGRTSFGIIPDPDIVAVIGGGAGTANEYADAEVAGEEVRVDGRESDGYGAMRMCACDRLCCPWWER